MTIAHTRTRRAYTRVHLRGRDNEASVDLVVRVKRGREPLAHYKQIRAENGVRGRQSKNEKEKDSILVVGHRRWSRGDAGGSGKMEGGRWSPRSLTCHLVRVTFARPRLILERIPRSLALGRPADKASLQFERHEFAGWIIRGRSTKEANTREARGDRGHSWASAHWRRGSRWKNDHGDVRTDKEPFRNK